VSYAPDKAGPQAALVIVVEAAQN